MKKYQIFLLKIFSWFFLFFMFILSFKATLETINFNKVTESFVREFPVEEFEKLKNEAKKVFVIKLPENTLRISLKLEGKGFRPYKHQLAIKENEIFFKVLFGWGKINIGNETLKNIENWVKFLKEKQIFARFERKNGEAEFFIKKEKLKEIISEFGEKGKATKDLEKLDDLFGKIFYNDKGQIKKIEVESQEEKISIEFQNLKEKTNKEDLENLILSLLQ